MTIHRLVDNYAFKNGITRIFFYYYYSFSEYNEVGNHTLM